MRTDTFNPEAVRHRIMVTLANQNLTSAELEERLYDIVDSEVQKADAELEIRTRQRDYWQAERNAMCAQIIELNKGIDALRRQLGEAAFDLDDAKNSLRLAQEQYTDAENRYGSEWAKHADTLTSHGLLLSNLTALRTWSDKAREALRENIISANIIEGVCTARNWDVTRDCRFIRERSERLLGTVKTEIT